ncbi:hypothetical protein [Stieleria magnilauensis]|uniref:Uncharacterized protein n=2 Tax=Stieleria TaxID=2795973 RepID=A0ABX5Y0F6_9BACT|nr:hypothetical protein TBK1r_68000 [Planctomycetes bacterium TBK1r]
MIVAETGAKSTRRAIHDQEPFSIRMKKTMNRNGLTFNSRKALMNNIGEAAGTEIANLIAEMAAEIEELRRNKVNVTRIVPATNVNLMGRNEDAI